MAAQQGLYKLRVTILPRVLSAQGPNGEEVESWPGPGASYFARPVALSAGETITQGIREPTGAAKYAIRGRAISVSAVDRLQKHTGELWSIVGVVRDEAEDETVLSCERVHAQATGQ